MYEALAIANYFLDKFNNQLNPMKLEKLCFFAYMWNLVLYKNPLFIEMILVDEFGIRIISIYNEFKLAGNDVIRSKGLIYDFDSDKFVKAKINMDDVQTVNLLNRIIEVYGDYSSLELSAILRKEDGLFDIISKQYPNRRYMNIPDKLIQEYGLKQLNKINGEKNLAKILPFERK
jgi:uncharacterized phage-associated protein